MPCLISGGEKNIRLLSIKWSYHHQPPETGFSNQTTQSYNLTVERRNKWEQ